MCDLETQDHLDALCEIVDALASTLAAERPESLTLRLIADRARKLYQQERGTSEHGP